MYMACVQEEKTFLESHLQSYYDGQKNINKTFDFLYPKYIEHMAFMYMNTGCFNDGKKQYLYTAAKLENSSAFIKVTFFQFINNYMNANIKDLTSCKSKSSYDSSRDWTEIREKSDLYKNLEKLRICAAKECMQINKIHKHLIVNIDSLEKHAAESTMTLYHYAT